MQVPSILPRRRAPTDPESNHQHCLKQQWGFVGNTECLSMQNWPVLMKMREVKMYVMVNSGVILEGSIDRIILTTVLPEFFLGIR